MVTNMTHFNKVTKIWTVMQTNKPEVYVSNWTFVHDEMKPCLACQCTGEMKDEMGEA